MSDYTTRLSAWLRGQSALVTFTTLTRIMLAIGFIPHQPGPQNPSETWRQTSHGSSVAADGAADNRPSRASNPDRD
jgi:hypothetical protein